MNNETLSTFAGMLSDAGLLVDHIEIDGRLHRCGTRNKPRSRNGYYVVHLDHPASLSFGNYDEGTKGQGLTVQSKSELTPAERKLLQARIRKEKNRREKIQELKWKAAAVCAEKLFQSAGEVDPSFPYLVNKGIEPAGDVRQMVRKGRVCLVIPIRKDGALTGLQFIRTDGSKRFLKNTMKKGASFAISAKPGKGEGPIYIAEGYATAVSVHAATGCRVLVSFDAGNLAPVALAARKDYPVREIILAADNDKPSQNAESPGGVGVAKALKAARDVAGLVAIPRREGMDALDWNDLHKAMGLDEVRTQLLAARRPDDEDRGAEGSGKSVSESVSAGVAKDPYGFRTIRTGKRPGLYWLREKEVDGIVEEEEIYIGPPLDILGESRDADSQNWGKWAQWTDDDGQEHRWAIPASMLAGDGVEVAAAFLSMGWKLDPMQRRNLIRYLSAVQTEKRVRCVPRVGWHDGTQGKPVYVLPDAVIGDAGPEAVVLQTTAHHATPFFSCRGKLSVQVETFKLCLGNSRLILALCTSFAGPLLKLAGVDSGGFNLWGGSSTGESTALHVAGSVWDYVDTLTSWRSTDNALEGLLALHSDNLLLLDEISQAPDKAVSEAVYMAGNGRGKARARADASIKAAQTWRAMILSSGEMKVTTRIEATGRRVQAGQEVRLADVPADAGAGLGAFENLHGYADGNAFSIALKDAARAHCGHAGRAFLEYLTQNMDRVKGEVSAALDGMVKGLCPAGSDGQVLRVARRFALCAYAGWLAADAGLFGDDVDAVKGDIAEGVKKCFAAWLADRGGTEAGEDSAIMRDIARFFEQYGESCFRSVSQDGNGWHADEAEKILRQFGYRFPREHFFLVMPESFKADVCKGHDHKRARRVLWKRGHLKCEKKDRFTCRVTIDGELKTGYHVNFSIASGAAADTPAAGE